MRQAIRGGLVGLLALSTLVLAVPEAKADTYKVDPVHTSILFKINHMGLTSFYGRFIGFKGTLDYDGDNVEKSAVELTVKADSIRTWSQQRDAHLKSPDFFNVKQFPEISFKSKAVEALEGDTMKVTGDLSLHGVTREITIEIEKTGEGKGPRGDDRIGFETEFTIKRSDFGMTTYVANGALGDEVTLIIAIEAVK